MKEERNIMDVIKEALDVMAPGLKNIVPDVKAEMSRLTTQGTMELASALFGNGAFVPYGPGQYTPKPEVAKEGPDQEIQKEEPQQEQERERGGMER
jgi:hypothetical protein